MNGSLRKWTWNEGSKTELHGDTYLVSVPEKSVSLYMNETFTSRDRSRTLTSTVLVKNLLDPNALAVTS